MDSYGLFGCAIYGALTVITAYQIYDHVPEPYMDEIFHIPQAQKYCSGKFLEVCMMSIDNIHLIQYSSSDHLTSNLCI